MWSLGKGGKVTRAAVGASPLESVPHSVSAYAQKNPLAAEFLWSNSDTSWVNFNRVPRGNVCATSSTSACVETSSWNSGSILGHLLSTSLDLAAQELMDGRAAHEPGCQGLHGNSVSRIILLGNRVLIGN